MFILEYQKRLGTTTRFNPKRAASSTHINNNNTHARKALRSFPARTGCGASGLHAQHLKDALRTGTSDANKEASRCITAVVKHMLEGRLPQEFAPFVTMAPLMALAKPNGGVRPIAVGEIWRRLASKVAMRQVRGGAAAVLEPEQVGVYTQGGA